jgi:import inner membrane translocase subunit TIM21
MTTSQKVVHSTRVVSYSGIVLAGIAVLGAVGYALFYEFFSKDSPQSMFGEALKKVQKDPRVEGMVGDSIKGYGQESYRRFSRQMIQPFRFQENGTDYIRFTFRINGSQNKGSVHVEMARPVNASFWTSWGLSYMRLDTDDRRRVVLEDNREQYRNDPIQDTLQPLT